MIEKPMPARSPRNVQYLRKTNRGALLRILAQRGQSTRAELAEALGLTKMAISTIVADLLREGLVEELGVLREEDGASPQGIGRKPVALRIAPGKLHAVGLLITRYELQFLLMDITGAPIAEHGAPIPERITNREFEATLVREVSALIAGHPEARVLGIGVASLGPLDVHDQVLLHPPNFRGLGGLSVGALLRRELRLPVFMENDMNACALAEQYYGQGKQLQNLIYVGFGSGVGAGVILGGSMLHGGSGFAGELGHVSTDLDGPMCSCGQRGCLEMYTSTGALLSGSGAASIEQLREMLSRPSIPDAAERVMQRYVLAIRSALITVANLFDPDIIVLGDEHQLLDSAQLHSLEQHLNRQMFQHGYRTIGIVPSSFGAKNSLIGGAALVFQEVFRGKLPV